MSDSENIIAYQKEQDSVLKEFIETHRLELWNRAVELQHKIEILQALELR